MSGSTAGVLNISTRTSGKDWLQTGFLPDGSRNRHRAACDIRADFDSGTLLGSTQLRRTYSKIGDGRGGFNDTTLLWV
jgi:hypothetical protein